MPTSTVRTGNVRLDDIDFHAHNVRVNLGDLRDLTDSIRRFGILQPVVLEQRGQRLRVRAGHRRVAAARLAGLQRIPAMVHANALDDDEWLIAAVHENTRRRGLDDADRLRTIASMRDAGLRTAAVAEAFGVSITCIKRWEHPETRHDRDRGPRDVRSALKGQQLRTFAQEARVRVEAGTWDTAQLLAAVERLAHTCRLTDALDHDDPQHLEPSA